MRAIATKQKSRRRPTSVKLRTNGKHKIDAASTIKAPIGNSMGRILRPQALFRWLGPQLASITPTYIEQTMLGAMAGNTTQAWSLFDVMLKSWPELLACYQELIESVIRKKLVYEPYCEEDEKPTPSALEKQKVVATALRRMQPDPTRDDSDLEGTIRDVLDAWFRGMAVSEVIWQTVDDAQVGTITAPKSTFPVDVTNYAYAADGSLGIRINKTSDSGVWPYSSTALNPQPNQLAPFSNYPNKFLIAMHKASGGSPLGGALLRPLAWWWCAANFSSDWLLNLAQLFGLPFRWVTYDQASSSDTLAAIDQMLQNMGSNGWARFPTGTTMEMLQTGKEGSDHSPQGELLDRADRYARSLILGQTMTGSHGTTGKGGGQAFGKVEMEVKSDRVDAAGKFAVQVINQQLVPSILMLNFGDTDEMPTLKFLEDEVADLTEAQRDKTLADAGLEIGVDYLRKKYDIPEPADGEDTIGGTKPAPSFGGFGQQDFGNQDPNAPDAENPTETKAPNEESDIGASDQTGHPFRGNQYVRLGEHVNTPHGQGVVLANDPQGAWVSVNGTIHKVKYSDISKIPTKPPFPSLLPSEENKRRLMRNAGLQTGDAVGHSFHGNQYTTGEIVTVDTGGTTVATDSGGSYAGMGPARVINPHSNAHEIDWTRQDNIREAAKRNPKRYYNKDAGLHVPRATVEIDRSKRGLANFRIDVPHYQISKRDIAAKLLELSAIEDDAVFSSELLQLTEGLK